MKGCPLGISGLFLIRWVYALPRALGSWGEGGNTVQGPSCRHTLGSFLKLPPHKASCRSEQQQDCLEVS